MKQIVKFSLENKNQYVLIEIETLEGGKIVKASRSDDAVEAKTSLIKALSQFRPLITSLSQILDHTDMTEGNVDIAFGLKLTLDGEIVVTTGLNEANFMVTIHRTQ